jgi:group I intron endonuclease
MSEILLDNSNVVGHIYKITNIKNNKIYIGQTLSHRKNRGKYRPFGYEGRFKDHLSEALCNSKKKQCTYLNNAIRLYGKESFIVTLITECNKDDLDDFEIKYIKEHSSLYPNGYNLTSGGKTFKKIVTPDVAQVSNINLPKRRGGCKERTPETRAKMTKSLKHVFGTPDARLRLMKKSQLQHSKNKLDKFKGVIFDTNNIDQYIRIRKSKDGSQYIKVCIDDKSTTFVGKYETLDILRNRAIEFIKLVNLTATLPNCSGNA